MKTALSKLCPQTGDESKCFLSDFIAMVTDLVIVDKRGKSAWKPLQTCALLSTLCALQLLEHYAVEKKFRFLMLSRRSPDALENLFSTIRLQTAIPRAREFKATFRVIVLAQFSQPSHHGCYAVDDEQDLLAFVRDKSEYEKQLGEEVDTSFEGISQLCEEEEGSLLYFAGYMAYAVIHKYKLCSTCKASIVRQHRRGQRQSSEVWPPGHTKTTRKYQGIS